MTQALIWLYATLLRSYPRQFRAEFGDEMRAVFNEAIHYKSVVSPNSRDGIG